MYFDTRVPIPEKTVKTAKGKSTYVMFRIKHYNKARKYNTYETTTVGKVCDNDPNKMYPNDNYLKIYPNLAAQHIYGSERNNTLNVGAFAVLKVLARRLHLDTIIKKAFPDDNDKADLLLDVAIYFAIKSTNVVQGYPAYAKCHPSLVKDKIYSDATISNVLNTISTESRDIFLKEWTNYQEIEALKRNEHVYMSCDSTNISCQSINNINAKQGHNKEKNGKNIVNIMYLFSHASNLPYIYDIYDGSINDGFKLDSMLEIADKYGVKNLTLILDRGFCYEPDIRKMDERGVDYIVMLNGKVDLLKDLYSHFHGMFEDNFSDYIPKFENFGVSMPKQLYHTSRKLAMAHLYFDPELAEGKRKRLNDEIGEMIAALEKARFTPKKFAGKYLEYFDIHYNENKEGVQVISDFPMNDKVVKEDFALCGYFVIISSEALTAREALERYKKRDAIEKTFARDKTWMSRGERVHSAESFEGKRLVEFITLILKTEFGNELWQLTTPGGGRPNFAHIPRAIEELENITICRRGTLTYSLDNPYTKTQKDILSAFDLNTVSMNKEIDAVTKDLNGNVNIKLL